MKHLASVITHAVKAVFWPQKITIARILPTANTFNYEQNQQIVSLPLFSGTWCKPMRNQENNIPP